MPIKNIAGRLTDVDTTPRYALGTLYECPNVGAVDRGEQIWVYVYNDEPATAFAQGNIIMRDDATLTADGVLATAGTVIANARVLGVAQHAIAAGSYGWILKKGIGEVLMGNVGSTANTAITTGGAGAAGTALTFAANNEHAVIGFATETVGAGALATCWINCLGI